MFAICTIVQNLHIHEKIITDILKTQGEIHNYNKKNGTYNI